MRSIKSLSLVASLAFLLLMLAAGCAASTSTPSPIPTLTPTPIPVAFPITITDGLGRSVTISALPGRIVSLAPSNTEILFAVGAGDQVVGVTTYDTFPPEAQGREKIGGFSAKSISVEKILSLKPDLVFSGGKSHETISQSLEQAGIVVVAIEARTFEDVYDTIRLVGWLTGHSEEATGVVTGMRERVAHVQKKVETVPQEERPTVFYEVWDEPLMTAGPTTFIGQMIDLAGGTNVFSDVREQYPQISTEEVVKRNPRLILGPDSHGSKLAPEQVFARPGWGQVDAVKNGRIYLVNGDMVSRSGPRLADALEAVVKAFYPDLFQ